VPLRLQSCKVQQNLFTTVAVPRVPVAHYGQRAQNVFNNKADFKVLLPEFSDGPQVSVKGLGGKLEPAWETLR
jgi:hypothetical protein